MKALTLRHPWPFAITAIGKRIENRTWQPSPKQLAIGDRFAIHGGVVPKNGSVAMMRIVAEAITIMRQRGYTTETDPAIEIVGGIVAIATFGGVVTESDDQWFDGSGFGWVLTDALVLPKPIPCKGAQGLWEVPDHLLKEHLQCAS